MATEEQKSAAAADVAAREAQSPEASSRAPSASEEKAAAATGPNQSVGRLQKLKQRRNILIGAGILVVILAIVIPVAVVFSNKSSSDSSSQSNSDDPSGSGSSSSPAHSSSNNDNIPKWARGGYLDTSTWYTTKDFNTTFTDEKVGGLYVMGLNSTWDDKTRANENVPALDEEWQYGTMPIQGINIGGWFLLEPFLTPALWDQYPLSLGIIDEWTLCDHLGPDKAKSTLEKNYAEFGSEEDFAAIQAAGFDHVRIPFGYWTVKTYDNEPYVPMVSFRYLLRSIEWARKYGLRIFLDLHAVPGSQNGWTHSGHIGSIDWLKGPNGKLNGDRTLEIHKQLSTFFSQDRYKNIITLYGLVNEPEMPKIGVSTVMDWYQKAIPTIRNAGYKNLMIMSEGFIDLDQWSGSPMQGIEGLVMDMHPYIVYDTDLLSMNHSAKVDYACTEWQQEANQAMNTATGFGPTIIGEFSYADTECALYQNGVGVGSRWNGSFDGVKGPQCPEGNSQCSCTPANAQPSQYSAEYKLWMSSFLQAQISAWGGSWGWFHWTWKAEGDNAPQWTYKAGLDEGYLPKNIQQRTFECGSSTIPDFAAQGLPEWY